MEPEKAFEAAGQIYTGEIQEKNSLILIRIWDLPLRIFHWTLAVTFITAFITGQLGGDLMDIHAKAGLLIIGLIAFRITWGFIGSTHARFKHFMPSPKRVRTYIKGQWQGVGHNPLGALSIVAMLSLLATQAILGLFSNDDIMFEGPLSGLVDKTLSDKLTGLHYSLSNVLLGLVVLHIAAIVYYLWFKKENLVKPMLTGRKEVYKGQAATKVNLLSFAIAIVVAAVSVYLANGWR